jgi:hypothetical protein
MSSCLPCFHDSGYLRISLRAYVRRQGGTWSRAQKLEVAQRRERLRSRIDSFNRAALSHLRGVDDGTQNADDISPLSDEDSEDEVDPFAPSEELFTGEPEARALLLPSTVGYVQCHRLRLHKLIDKEIALREGQANDALEGLRSGIGEKSFRYRQHLRHAKGNIESTRARSGIQTVGRALNHHRRVYGFARRALIALAAETEDESTRYKPVTLADLQVSTVIYNTKAPGQRNKRLAWFWSSHVIGETEDTNAMTECMYTNSFYLVTDH